MQLHERTMKVQGAGIELSGHVWDTIKKHDLTYGEITSLLSQEIIKVAKYQIRTERHPNNPSKRGDEA